MMSPRREIAWMETWRHRPCPLPVPPPVPPLPLPRVPLLLLGRTEHLQQLRVTCVRTGPSTTHRVQYSLRFVTWIFPKLYRA